MDWSASSRDGENSVGMNKTESFLCIWVVTRSPIFKNVMPLLKSLHLLRVRYIVSALRSVPLLTRHIRVGSHRIYILCLVL